MKIYIFFETKAFCKNVIFYIGTEYRLQISYKDCNESIGTDVGLRITIISVL